MTCHQIVIKLGVYRLQSLNILNLQENNEFTLEVINQYSFITIRIYKSGQSFAQLRFEVTDECGKPICVYCVDALLQKTLNNKIELENWPGWESPSSIDLPYSNQVLHSMQTADNISAITKNCARGDNYWPGNFSKISVDSDCITLEQINHMNAKSLAHKNDYSLRNLVFTIPLQSNPKHERSRTKYQVGIMTIEFSDRSSKNNRKCGEEIIAELEKLTGV